MKHSVTEFISLEVALKELEPFIKNGFHLKSGKSFNQFDGMRSREMLANWFICAALNFEYKTKQYFFTSDPGGGDGTIVDLETKCVWLTEHVMVPQARNAVEKGKDIALRILEAINLKRDKGGRAYASNKLLVIFLDSTQGQWLTSQVAKQLSTTLYFEGVWAVCLQGVVEGKYSYGLLIKTLSTGM